MTLKNKKKNLKLNFRQGFHGVSPAFVNPGAAFFATAGFDCFVSPN
jgi:hypothetical protein